MQQREEDEDGMVMEEWVVESEFVDFPSSSEDWNFFPLPWLGCFCGKVGGGFRADLPFGLGWLGGTQSAHGKDGC